MRLPYFYSASNHSFAMNPDQSHQSSIRTVVLLPSHWNPDLFIEYNVTRVTNLSRVLSLKAQYINVQIHCVLNRIFIITRSSPFKLNNYDWPLLQCTQQSVNPKSISVLLRMFLYFYYSLVSSCYFVYFSLHLLTTTSYWSLIFSKIINEILSRKRLPNASKDIYVAPNEYYERHYNRLPFKTQSSMVNSISLTCYR